MQVILYNFVIKIREIIMKFAKSLYNYYNCIFICSNIHYFDAHKDIFYGRVRHILSRLGLIPTASNYFYIAITGCSLYRNLTTLYGLLSCKSITGFYSNILLSHKIARVPLKRSYTCGLVQKDEILFSPKANLQLLM